MRELRNVIVLNFYQFVLITEKWEARKPLKGWSTAVAHWLLWLSEAERRILFRLYITWQKNRLFSLRLTLSKRMYCTAERELGWCEKCEWVEQSVELVGRGPKGLRCAVCLSLHSLMDVVHPAPALWSSSFLPKSFISGTLRCFARWLTEWNWSSARQAEGRRWGWGCR